MLIGHIAGGFGDALSDVKSLQQQLQALWTISGKNKNYAGVKVTGIVDWETVRAIFHAWWDGVAELPVLEDLVGLVADIPGVGSAIKSENVLWVVWNIPSAYDKIVSFIKAHSKIIRAAIAAAALELSHPPAPGGGGGGGGMFQQLPGGLAPSASTFPAGAFAVRDPVLGQYRILMVVP
jgi:hypothetical protein